LRYDLCENNPTVLQIASLVLRHLFEIRPEEDMKTKRW
jgi:hypothetical protein